MQKTIAVRASPIFPHGAFEKRRWPMNGNELNKSKMGLLVYGPAWNQVIRIALVIVKKPDILNFAIIKPGANTCTFILMMTNSDL